MNPTFLFAIAYSLSSVVSSEIICSTEDPTDCYPIDFVPTNEWQVIREGQNIPQGLHVRLNIDTLEKEAKLIDTSEESNHEIVAVDVPEPQESPRMKSKISKEDLSTFDGAISEVGDFSDDYDRLHTSLDVLEDLSHDIEFGAKLTTAQSLTKLNHALATADEKAREKIFRLLGSSLRNNPEAINGFLRSTDRAQVMGLFNHIGGDSSPSVQKRILGIISALAQNDLFRSVYLNNYGLEYLVERYPSMDSECKERLVNILEDQEYVSKRDDDTPDSQMSTFLQSSLADGKLSPAQTERYFTSLVSVHSDNKSLKPSEDFMMWLTKEIEGHKENRKRGSESSEFENEMLRARHDVFGNPMAKRKAFADEL